MSWFEPKPEKPLREQLLEARGALINHIRVLENGPIRARPGESFQDQADALKVTLREIEDELAKTGSSDAQGS